MSEEKHESYGVIQVSRVSSNKFTTLFGSSIKHANYIQLRIFKGVRQRHSNREWYHHEAKPIIEVSLSEAQFGRFLSSINMGDGTPCTIAFHDGKAFEAPPYENQRMVFENEFKKEMQKVTSGFAENINSVEEILSKKSLNKEDKANVMSALTRVKAAIDDVVPFIQASFNEAIDHSTTEAKGEIEAFILNKVFNEDSSAMKAAIESLLPESSRAELPEAVNNEE